MSDRKPIDPDFRRQLSRLAYQYEGMAHAIRTLVERGWPTEEDLGDIPTVVNWTYSKSRSPCLEGNIFGVDGVDATMRTRTPHLIVRCPERELALTAKGYYRTEQQLQQDDLTQSLDQMFRA